VEECPLAVVDGAEYTRKRPRKVVVRKQHELAESRSAPDAPSHSRMQPVLLLIENDQGQNQAGEAYYPHTVCAAAAAARTKLEG
jgi:hypothetical protein